MRPSALRLAVALAPWWLLRGRLRGSVPAAARGGRPRRAGQRRVVRRAVLARPGRRCTRPIWPGRWATSPRSATPSGTGGRPGRWPTAWRGRSTTLANLGRIAEAADDGRRSLALARELGYPAGEALALARLSLVASDADDLDSAVQLARQAEQIPADIPGWIARICSYIVTVVLIEAGDLAAAERVCAAGLARSRDAGDLWNLADLLTQMAILDLQAGRVEDAAAHLREALQIAARTGGRIELLNGLDCCGYLCAATGRRAEAVTVWAAFAALLRHEGLTDRARGCAPPARTAARGPAGARTRPGPRGRGTRRGDEPGHRGRVRPDAHRPRPAAAGRGAGPGQLSARERELVTLVAQGRTDAQIAAQLYISVRTVGSHLDRIRDKTGCRRRADLTRLALTAGLV